MKNEKRTKAEKNALAVKIICGVLALIMIVSVAWVTIQAIVG